MSAIYQSGIFPATCGLYIVIISIIQIVKMTISVSHFSGNYMLIFYGLLFLGLFLFFYGISAMFGKSKG